MATGQRVESIDVFRGIAILSVVLFHFTARLPPESLNVSGQPVWPVFFGWVGVYFFYAISGYCIFLTLEKSATVSTFLARRFSRIYPAFLAAVVLLFAYGIFAYIPSVPAAEYRVHAPGPLDVMLNLLFIGEIGEWVNGSFWSIAVEVKFYLLLGLMALVLVDHRQLARWFTMVSLLAAPLWIIADQGGEAAAHTHLLGKLVAFLTIAPYLPFFAIGILGRMQMRGEMKTGWFMSLAVIESAVVIFFESLGEANATADLHHGLVAAAIFLGMMALFLAFVHKRPIPHIPYISAGLAGIGFYSFSWYLVHETLGYSFLFNLHHMMPNWLAVAIAVLLTFLIGVAFASLFEWRFRKVFEHLATGLLSRIAAVFAFRRAATNAPSA